eukprot:CAMPEP_0184383208 /NCGR_PEP_ID=MMETSP0007-20130409/6958_1 /TAXON_ID=97485 /ORGANISM="Prymnesium parvum, Strain Texoma1" /LENGTH=59 /DNA_ID=CAMNT_0026729589 /DNA_START=119 /DNA_END=296 /DNA_ORIENTATION=-
MSEAFTAAGAPDAANAKEYSAGTATADEWALPPWKRVERLRPSTRPPLGKSAEMAAALS